MDIKREQTLKSLAERFATFSNVVTIQNKAGFNDINKSAERLFIDILNISYNLGLRDMNDIQENYPAIDLGDYNSRVCFQVTSESSNQKFRKTIEKFKEKQLDRDFDKLVFLIISNKNLCSLKDKEVETAVISLNDLYKQISTLSDRDIYYIDNYLSQSLVTRIESNDSILPTNLIPAFTTPHPRAFIKFLGLESEPEYIDQLLNDLKKLSRIISNLTTHQREYLFYIVANGQFPQTRYSQSDETSVVIPTTQMQQVFGEYGYQIFQVLKAQDLLWINDEYDPHDDGRYITVMVPYFRGELDDTNLFAYIKSFSQSDANKLRKIFIECDFSCLA